jgi:hypothetical protein
MYSGSEDKVQKRAGSFGEEWEDLLVRFVHAHRHAPKTGSLLKRAYVEAVKPALGCPHYLLNQGLFERAQLLSSVRSREFARLSSNC